MNDGAKVVEGVDSFESALKQFHIKCVNIKDFMESKSITEIKVCRILRNDGNYMLGLIEDEKYYYGIWYVSS